MQGSRGINRGKLLHVISRLSYFRRRWGEGQVAELPVQHAIMVLAIEGFGTHDTYHQASLRSELLAVAEHAVRDVSGLRWEDFRRADRDDGSLMLILPVLSPVVRLAGPFIENLNRRLMEGVPGGSTVPPMRLRVALHLGPAGLDTRGWFGVGIDLAAKLVDAEPVGLALKAATGARLAFIVSDETHESVIRNEYRLIDAAAYTAVRFGAGQLTGVKAWITVPGYSAPPGITPDRTDGTSGAGPEYGHPAAGRTAPYVSAGTVHGNVIGVQNNTFNNPGSVQL
jgi:hypothetical protein